MQIAVNCTQIDTSKTLGVWRFGQRLVKSIKNRANAEMVALISSAINKDNESTRIFDKTIMVSPDELVEETFDIELLLMHFQTPYTNAPKAVILHDLHIWDVPWKYPDLEVRQENLKTLLMASDAIMVHFPRTYYDLPKVVPELHNRLFLTVIPPMIEYVDEDTDLTLKTKKQYGISKHEKVLLYPAQLQPHKNHLNLFRAMKILESDPVRLVCTGSELQRSHAKKLHQFISELGLEKKIIITGRLDDRVLENMYHVADLVVFASMAESGATIAEEAILYDKPIIYSDIRASRLHLEKMRASIPLFNPLNPRDIAETISSALTTPQDNTQAKAIIKSWTWDKLAEQYCYVLDWLKAGKPSGEMPMFLDDSLGYLRKV